MNRESNGASFAEAVERSRLTKSQISRALGVSPQSVTNWEKRGVPSRYALAVAQLMHVDPGDISSVEVRDIPGTYGAGVSAALLPMYRESGARAGFRYADAGLVDDDSLLLLVESEAMAPAITKGDVLAVSCGASPLPGQTVVAQDPAGRYLVRRYREIVPGGAFQLVPACDDFASITVETESGYKIIGTVSALIRRM